MAIDLVERQIELVSSLLERHSLIDFHFHNLVLNRRKALSAFAHDPFKLVLLGNVGGSEVIAGEIWRERRPSSSPPTPLSPVDYQNLKFKDTKGKSAFVLRA